MKELWNSYPLSAAISQLKASSWALHTSYCQLHEPVEERGHREGKERNWDREGAMEREREHVKATTNMEDK
jgi:hypothetical protein